MFLPGEYFVGMYLANHQEIIQNQRSTTPTAPERAPSWRHLPLQAESVHLTHNEKLAQQYPHIIIPETLLCDLTCQFMDHPVAIKKNAEEIVFIDRFLLEGTDPINPYTNQKFKKNEISEKDSAVKMQAINEFKRKHFPHKLFGYFGM